MLQVDNLCFRYGDDEFRYDFTVERGECLALLGTSGAGKTSLLNLLAGFIAPDSGAASFDGESLLDKSPDKRPISMIFQEHNLFSHLSVAENVALGVEAGDDKSQVAEKIVTALSQVELHGFGDRFPEDLSGGERRRVALGRALVRNKPLLLLDEAFTALHPALRYDMLDLLNRLRKDKGLTVILVTHLPEEALRVADKIAFIESGEILIVGDAKSLLNDPPIPQLKKYLGQL